MSKRFATAFLAAIPLLALPLLPTVTGCATIVSGRTAEVALRSDPPEANVTVRDHEGQVVAQTITPGEVTLKRGRTWLRPAQYNATFEKPGYETTRAPLYSKFNPWVLGNIVLGGPFGLGVDLTSGSMWRPKSPTVERTLAQAGAAPPTTPYEPAPTTTPTPTVQMASAAEPVPAPR